MSAGERAAFERITSRMNRYELARVQRLNAGELRLLIDLEMRNPQPVGTYTPQAAA